MRWPGPLALLIVSVVLVAAAPLAIDESYSILENTTSESAGQLVDGSWVARTGFLCFGLAVLWLAQERTPDWGLPGTTIHRAFGVSMIGVATFASRPWSPAAAYDATEDLLHSVASFGVGTSFTFGVLVVGMRRARATGKPRWSDVAAFVLAPSLSLALTNLDEVAGVLQRAMFAIAYLWYGAEARPLPAEQPEQPELA